MINKIIKQSETDVIHKWKNKDTPNKINKIKNAKANLYDLNTLKAKRINATIKIIEII